MTEFEKASPRPWTLSPVNRRGEYTLGVTAAGVAAHTGKPLVDAEDGPSRYTLATVHCAGDSRHPDLFPEMTAANAALAFHAVNSFAPLVAAVEFALARFCDPHALDTDPAAVRLKELCEAALALACPPQKDR